MNFNTYVKISIVCCLLWIAYYFWKQSTRTTGATPPTGGGGGTTPPTGGGGGTTPPTGGGGGTTPPTGGGGGTTPPTGGGGGTTPTIGQRYAITFDNLVPIINGLNIRRHFTTAEVAGVASGAISEGSLAYRYRTQIIQDLTNAGYQPERFALINANGTYALETIQRFFEIIQDFDYAVFSTQNSTTQLKAHIRTKTGKEPYGMNYIKTR
jgi:hypothetical protein